MNNWPCPKKLECGWNIPNYSSEGEELRPPIIIIIPPPPPPPPPGYFTAEGCISRCVSYESQQEANLCALAQEAFCITTDPRYSAEATCTVACPDGTEFTYIVPAGMFLAQTQPLADALASAYACEQAASQRVCLSDLPTCGCVGTFWAASIVTVGTISSWVLLGTLPPGLAFAAGVIAGTPTTAGNYSFIVRAYLANGCYATRGYTVSVMQITTTALPNGTEGADYDYQVTGAGGTGPWTFTLVDGSFPIGVDITSSGLITGVVGEVGVFTPTIRMTDSLGCYCEKQITLTAESNCPKMPIVTYTLPAVGGATTGPFDASYRAWWMEYPSSARLDAGNRVLVCGRSQLSPYRPHGLSLYDFSTDPATFVQYIDGPGTYANVMQQFMVDPDTRKVVGRIGHRNSGVAPYTNEYFFLNQNTLLMTYLLDPTPLNYNTPVYMTGNANRIAFCKGSGDPT